MSIGIGSDIVIGRRMGVALSGGSAATPWWLAGGTIDDANVLEHVEFPADRQPYAGPAVANGQPWSIAIKTRWLPSATTQIAFHATVGANYWQIISSASWIYNWGKGDGTQINADGNIFISDSTDRVYFFIHDGTAVGHYRENVFFNSYKTLVTPIGITTGCWCNRPNGGFLWQNPIIGGAVFNVALGEAQRGALYTSMAAL